MHRSNCSVLGRILHANQFCIWGSKLSGQFFSHRERQPKPKEQNTNGSPMVIKINNKQCAICNQNVLLESGGISLVVVLTLGKMSTCLRLIVGHYEFFQGRGHDLRSSCDFGMKAGRHNIKWGQIRSLHGSLSPAFPGLEIKKIFSCVPENWTLIQPHNLLSPPFFKRLKPA